MARPVEVKIGSWSLPGVLAMPDARARLVIFAHGSGSSRFSARNVLAAERLGDIGIATVLFDLSTEAEADDRRNLFDMPLLGARVVEQLSFDLRPDVEPAAADLDAREQASPTPVRDGRDRHVQEI